MPDLIYWYAAWDAGQKAAGDTERIWQEQRLSTIIRAVLPLEEQG